MPELNNSLCVSVEGGDGCTHAAGEGGPRHTDETQGGRARAEGWFYVVTKNTISKSDIEFEGRITANQDECITNHYCEDVSHIYSNKTSRNAHPLK